MIKQMLRPLVEAFPRPTRWLYWLWEEFDAYKPWKLLRVQSSVHRARQARLRPRTPRQVVIVTDVPRHREAKVAQGLRGAGWEVILLSRQPPDEELASAFSRRETYRDRWEALDLASRYSPVVYHVFASWLYRTAATLVRYRPGKIVIDALDVLGGLTRPKVLRNRFPGQRELERFCLENADGLCCRSLETQYVKKALGYRFKGPRLFFLDGTISSPPDGPRRPADGDIHVVHIGSITLERYEPHFRVGHYLDIARKLAAAGIHFHLYGGGAPQKGGYEATYVDYLALERETKYFHLHRTLPIPALVRELRQYTFGIHVAGIMLHFRNSDPDCPRARHDYYAPNRISELLAAGLPIILHEGKFLFWLAARLGVARLVDPGFLESPREWLERRRPTEEELRKLDHAWKDVDPARQIPRLVAFYEKIARGGRRPGGAGPPGTA